MNAAQMKKQMAGARGLPGGILKAIDSACEECTVCLKFARQPGIPVAGHRLTSAFNEHIEMDLLFHGEYAFLHIIDIHTHYNALKLIGSKKTEVVLEAFRNSWMLPFGIPKNVAMDAGGEFCSEAYSGEFAKYGITPHFKAK